MEKLNFGDIVIIDMNNQSPQKVKVLEVTEKTYLLANLDQRTAIVKREKDCEYVTFRISIGIFNLRYKVIEFIGNSVEEDRRMLEEFYKS